MTASRGPYSGLEPFRLPSLEFLIILYIMRDCYRVMYVAPAERLHVCLTGTRYPSLDLQSLEKGSNLSVPEYVHGCSILGLRAFPKRG